MTGRALAGLLAAGASLGAAERVVASPLFELVGGAGGDGGFNARVAGPGPASTYFNPALLPDAPTGLLLGTLFVDQRISIDVDARGSSPACQGGACDVPEVFGAGPESFRHEDGSPISSPTVPTIWLEQGKTDFAPRPRHAAGGGQGLIAYQIVGLVTRVFGERLVLGLHAMIPLEEFTTARAFYNDEREQYFSNSLHPELYSDRLTSTSMAFGVGSRVSRKLSLGATLTLSLKNRASAPVYVSNLSNLDTVLLDSDVGVRASVSPHFGVAYDPHPNVRFAATLHTPQSFEIDTSFEYLLATGSEQGTSVHFTHAYLPLAIALGGSWSIGDVRGHRFAVAGTAIFARWSRYRDRHSEAPHPDYAWADTISGALGVRHQRGALSTHLDVAYQPSPVPAQTGRTNYVDNDRVGVNAGFTHGFRLFGGRFRAGVELQAHRLLERHVTKFVPPDNPQPNPNLPGFGDAHYPQLVIDEIPDDAVDGQLGDPIPGRDGLQTNNPGFPGFGSGGWIFGASVSLTILY